MTHTGSNIQEAIRLLQEEQLVAIPTETVYGLAGNALSTKAIIEIFRVKNRPFFDPLIIHTDDLDKIGFLIERIPQPLLDLAHYFMPGPLTILVPKKDLIPDLVTSGSPKVAIRIPNHPIALELLSALEFPLAAPSANPFGYVSPTTAQHVLDQLGGLIPYILDGGRCQIGLESTIIDLKQGEIIVLRQGGVSVEEIEKIAGKVKVTAQSGSNPSAPGMLDHHYAPTIPVSLESIHQLTTKYPPEKIGYLAFSQGSSLLAPGQQRILSASGDLAEAAQNFFSHLRVLDKLNLDIIAAEFVPDVGLGRAINDKLRRSAGKR